MSSSMSTSTNNLPHNFEVVSGCDKIQELERHLQEVQKVKKYRIGGHLVQQDWSNLQKKKTYFERV